MATNPELISKEMIKPSSPTPNHLRHYKFSFLDQIAPLNSYTRVILFFNEASEYDHHVQRSTSLKKSLAKTLTHFHPLAGRPAEDSVIECNDDGAEYFEVKVPCKMEEVIKRCDTKELNQLLPYYIYLDIHDTALLAVQYNIFYCGKAAIGVCINHKIADGMSLVMFLNAFAAISRGDDVSEVRFPDFDAASHFPPTKNRIGFMSRPVLMSPTAVTKRFVFDKSSIDLLKEAASSDDDSQVKRRPSRVAVVTAFILRRLVAVFHLKSSQTIASAVLTVNIRERMVPPQPNSFGNLFLLAVPPPQCRSEKDRHPILVREITEAFRSVDADFVKEVQSKELERDGFPVLGSGIELVVFSATCRFPFYDIDFGWGKPIWAITPCRPYKNMIILMDAPGGEGIEAWVSLLEDDMAAFERDPEVISLLSQEE